MNNVIRYDDDQARAVEQAVIAEFGCQLKDIVSVSDTLFKKIVVYVLHAKLGFSERIIGPVYSMTWPYVPTVSKMISVQMLHDPAFGEKVNNVLKSIQVYGISN